MLEQEPIKFFRVCNIVLRKCEREELKEWAQEGKRLWKAALKRVPDEHDQMFLGMSTPLEKALDRLFYGFGGLFHVDLETNPTKRHQWPRSREH